MEQQKPRLTVIGTTTRFRGIGSYLNPFVVALTQFFTVDLIDFRHLYPAFLYKSRVQVMTKLEDNVEEAVDRAFIKVDYFNPFSWIAAGLFIKSDVVLINWWSPFLFPIYFTIMLILKLRGIKCVTTIHNIKFHESLSLYEILNRLIVFFSDYLMVHGESNKHELVKLFKTKKKVGVIHHGILDLGQQTQQNQSQAREYFKFPKDKFTLLFFGAIRPYKGLEVFVDALKYITKNADPSKFHAIIAGHPWYDVSDTLNEVNKISDKLSVTTYMKFVPDKDLPLYYYASDLTVLTYTEFNAQSGVAAESLSYGVPMIVSDLPTFKDWFHDLDCYFTSKDSVALAKKIIALQQDQKSFEEFKANQRTVKEDLSWESISKTVYDTFDSWKMIKK